MNATPTSQYKIDSKLHEQERDVAKYWDGNNIRLLMLGLENQSAIDSDMPLRVMGYDGAAYRHQLNMDEEVTSEDGKKYRKKNPRYPVVTIVLHFGEKEWKKPLSLMDTFKNMDKLPAELRPFIHDYSINVFDIPRLTLEQVKLFKSDFRYVAEYLVCKRLNKDYQPDKELLRHKDEVLKLMKILTGDNRYEELLNDFAGEESVSMCDVLDKVEARGRIEGIIEGQEKVNALNKILIEAKRIYCLSESPTTKASKSDSLPAESKKKKLQDDYGLQMVKEFEEKVNEMCNLGEGIAEKNKALGKAEGMAEGMVIGKAEGIMEEKIRSAKNFIDAGFATVASLKESGLYTDDEIEAIAAP
ncbi:unnamed protein product [Cylicocyclus nassatus]|uniref:Transposase (putative) YhgA-like domain-containing protein n=1 Tax=Cylicocyclus nassatus TaxID=53992 RepID=A0AA36GZ34_CYLNA|nr:unnamed protein product [Cylicocyclus nassatus]